MSSLATQDWQQVSFDHVVLTFLRGEAHKLKNLTENDCRLIQRPGCEDALENLRRCTLLYRLRGGLFEGVPPDTCWYQVQYLRNEHLDQLRVLREENWVSAADQNELGSVASRKEIRFLVGPKKIEDGTPQLLDYYSPEPEKWQSPVLWGHCREGPFTILEGTHRFVWYYPEAEAHPRFKNITYVGLSDMPCRWHMADESDVYYPLNPLSTRIVTLQNQNRNERTVHEMTMVPQYYSSNAITDLLKS